MLFIGDDWAEGHHDIEVEDDTGHRLARMRLSEGVDGLARLHEVVAEHLDTDTVGGSEGVVVVGIETDRGVWVSALLACGYQVFAINPMSAARYRERHSTSGVKSDAGDAHRRCAAMAAVLARLLPCSPTGETTPKTTSSISSDLSAGLRSSSAPMTSEIREIGLTSCRLPLTRPRPRGVRTASQIRASVIGSPKLSRMLFQIEC